jgi:hypothetical protein
VDWNSATHFCVTTVASLDIIRHLVVKMEYFIPHTAMYTHTHTLARTLSLSLQIEIQQHAVKSVVLISIYSLVTSDNGTILYVYAADWNPMKRICYQW